MRARRGSASGPTVVLFCAFLAVPSMARPATPNVTSLMNGLPLQFEANVGQTHEDVRFLARGRGYVLFLTASGAVVSGRGEAAFRWRLAGSRPSARIEPLNELPGTVSYFKGNDASRWHTDVRTYTRVRYVGIYPGIDLVYYGNQNNVECDFVVAPGSNPRAIRLVFDAPATPSVGDDGDLILRLGERELRLRKPVLYQEDGGVRRTIDGRYELHRGKSGSWQVGFKVARYEARKPLVIDPILALQNTTYLGTAGDDSARAIGLDGLGNTYVAGYTTDVSNFPGPPSQGGKIQPVPSDNNAQPVDTSGTYDGFLVKFDPKGIVKESVYFGGGVNKQNPGVGGGGGDVASALAVTDSGVVYVVGSTGSRDFPVTPGAPYQTLQGPLDAFVMAIAPAPDPNIPGLTHLRLDFSTYFGGNGSDEATAVAVDPDGGMYVTGSTNSTMNFPVFKALPGEGDALSGASGEQDVFVAHLTVAHQVDFSRYLGGSARDRGFGINGQGYITGETCSVDFEKPKPVANWKAVQPVPPGNACSAFMAHVGKDASGNAILKAFTYLGGSGYTAAHGIALLGGFADSPLVIVGEIEAPLVTDFPQSKTSYGGGNSDAFVAVISSDGAALRYFRFIGGNGEEQAFAVATDGVGEIYTAGTTCASHTNPTNSFPRSSNALPINGTQNAGYSPDPIDGTGCDAFIVKLDWKGDVAYSTFLGGSGRDIGWAIAVDGFGGAYVAGSTASQNFPVTDSSKFGGGLQDDAFVSKLDFPCAGKGPLAYTNLGHIIDTDGDCVLKDTPVPFLTSFNADGVTPTPLAMRPDGAMLYAVKWVPPQMEIFGVDRATNKETMLNSTTRPDFQDAVLAVSPDSNLVFAGAHIPSTVSVFNTAMDKLTLEHTFTYALHAMSVAVDPDVKLFNGLKAYVGHETGPVTWIHRDPNGNYDFGPLTNGQLGSISGPDSPINTAFTPDGKRFLATNSGGTVRLIDPAADKADGDVAVGGSAGIAVMPKPVGGAYIAYVSGSSEFDPITNKQCNGLTWINTSKTTDHKCIAIPGEGTSSIAITPDGSKVYVPDTKHAIWVVDTASNTVKNVILGAFVRQVPQNNTAIVIAPQDHNDNGIMEEVDFDDNDPNSKTFTLKQFNDSSSGTITDNGGSKVSVWHAWPKGFWVRAAIANNHDAQIDACNQSSTYLAPGSIAQLVCGSLTVNVISGRAKIDLGSGVFASITTGGSATETGTPGSYKLDNNGSAAITLINAAGQTIGSIGAGQSYPLSPPLACSPIAPFTYDGSAHSVPDGTCTSSVSGSFSYSYSSGSAPVNAGTYTFTATFTSSDPMYTNGTTTGTFTIESRSLAITANDAIKLVGAVNPAFTATYSGFAATEGPQVLAGTLHFDTPATASSPVGTYPVTPSGLASPNYNITFIAGTLTVTYNVCMLYDPAKPVNGGATVPIRVQLCSATGVNASSAGIVLTALKVTNAATNSVSTPVDAGRANPDQRFRFDSGAYIYNLKSTGLEPGAYTLTFGVTKDPMTHNAPFQVK